MIKQKSQHQNNVDDNLFLKKKIYNEKSGLGASKCLSPKAIGCGSENQYQKKGRKEGGKVEYHDLS